MATRRERAEKAEYDRLHAIYGKTSTGKAAVSRRVRDDQGDDDSPVIMLSGKRADSFLSWMFGESAPAPDPGDADPGDEGDEDDDEDDDDDDEDDDQDPPTERQGHRFFASRTRG